MSGPESRKHDECPNGEAGRHGGAVGSDLVVLLSFVPPRRSFDIRISSFFRPATADLRRSGFVIRIWALTGHWSLGIGASE